MALKLDMNKRFERILAISRSVPSGKQIARQLTYIVDSAIANIYKEDEIKYETQSKLSIVALGGYGRMELCPGSDIDLLYLHDELDDEVLSAIISHINTYLYDSGKQVGHACRTIEESISYTNYMESFFAVLDSRYIAGSESLFQKYCEEFLYKLPKDYVEKFSKLKVEYLERQLQLPAPYLVSEPNLKTSPFTMRDIQTFYWLEKLQSLIPPFRLPGVRHGFRPAEIRIIENAYDYLLKLRISLHSLSHSKQDRLDLTFQPELAEFMGYGPKNDISSVDRLMNHLYSHQKHAYFFIASYLDFARIQKKKERIPFELEGLKLIRIGNGLYPPLIGNFSQHPENINKDILKIFSISQDQDLEISPLLLEELRSASRFLDEDFKNSREAIEIFLNILKRKRKIGKILSLMHHCNILGKFIPEFGACKYFSLFSYHHEYPVDEHTLYILRELDKLCEGQFEDPEVQEIFNSSSDIEILVLSILLHDAGKVKEGDHCLYGKELAESVGQRFHLPEEQLDLFKYLVEAHIDMSELSTKRDISDPVLIQDFASAVRTVDRLKLLYVFTIIDTRSVGPGILTNWKKDILYNLYKKTLNFLQDRLDSQHNVTEQNLHSLKQYFIHKQHIPEKFMDGILEYINSVVPQTYIRYYTPIRIFNHFIHYQEFIKKKLSFPVVEIETEPAYITLVIYCEDYSLLSSDITGTVSSEGLSVVGMRSFRTKDKFSIQHIQLTDKFGSGEVHKEKLERLKRNLTLVLSGQLAVESLLSSPTEFLFFNQIPMGMIEEKVEFDNKSLPEYTVLEICFPDALGLLHRLLKAILSCGVIVDFVRVATSADYAYDSFYLKTAEGRKINDENLLKKIEAEIIQAVKKPVEKQVTAAILF